MVHAAYADQARYVVEEHADGSVGHQPVDPDGVDDGWQRTQQRIEEHLHEVLDPTGTPWRFHYLAGRADRALTHLARAVDAAAIVVGTRPPGPGARLREALDGSVAFHLAQHQHRPVLTVPLEVIDWRESTWR